MPTESTCWSVAASLNLDGTRSCLTKKACTTRCGGSRLANARGLRRGNRRTNSAGGAPVVHARLGRARCPSPQELSSCKRLDGAYCVRRERDVAAFQILLHMTGVGSAGQGQNSDATREAEHDLCRRGTGTR